MAAEAGTAASVASAKKSGQDKLRHDRLLWLEIGQAPMADLLIVSATRKFGPDVNYFTDCRPGWQALAPDRMFS